MCPQHSSEKRFTYPGVPALCYCGFWAKGAIVTPRSWHEWCVTSWRCLLLLLYTVVHSWRWIRRFAGMVLAEEVVQLKCDGTQWRTGGEVKGKLTNGVGSQYPSHYLGTWCIQHYYRWCAHLGCQQSTELTLLRPDLNGLVRFAERRKSDFCACAITFQTQSTFLTTLLPPAQ
jgi:hypothetical protein